MICLIGMLSTYCVNAFKRLSVNANAYVLNIKDCCIILDKNDLY